MHLRMAHSICVWNVIRQITLCHTDVLEIEFSQLSRLYATADVPWGRAGEILVLLFLLVTQALHNIARGCQVRAHRKAGGGQRPLLPGQRLLVSQQRLELDFDQDGNVLCS